MIFEAGVAALTVGVPAVIKMVIATGSSLCAAFALMGKTRGRGGRGNGRGTGGRSGSASDLGAEQAGTKKPTRASARLSKQAVLVSLEDASIEQLTDALEKKKAEGRWLAWSLRSLANDHQSGNPDIDVMPFRVYPPPTDSE